MAEPFNIDIVYRAYAIDPDDPAAVEAAILDLKFAVQQQKIVIDHVRMGLFGDEITVVTAKEVIRRCRHYLNELKLLKFNQPGSGD